MIVVLVMVILAGLGLKRNTKVIQMAQGELLGQLVNRPIRQEQNRIFLVNKADGPQISINVQRFQDQNARKVAKNCQARPARKQYSAKKDRQV